MQRLTRWRRRSRALRRADRRRGARRPRARAGARPQPGSPSRSPTARRSRRPSAAPDDDWDARVYAISPGSAAFLHAIGAWQALPPRAHHADRVDARRGRRRRACSTSRPTSSASARSRGSSRSARCAPRWSRRSMPPASTIAAPCSFDALDLVRRCGPRSRCEDGAADRRAARRRRRRPALVGARSAAGIAAPAAALRADRRSSPISPASARITAARTSGSAPTAASSPGCRCPGGGCRSSGRHRTRWRRSCSRSPPTRLPQRVAAAGAARARRASTCITPPAGFPLPFLQAAGDGRAPARARRRRRARRASARRAGRQPGLRRRRGAGRGAAPSAAPSRDAGAADPARALRAAGAPSRCWRCRRSPTGSPACSASRHPGCRPCATSAWPPSNGFPSPSACWRNPRCARLSSRPIPWRSR